MSINDDVLIPESENEIYYDLFRRDIYPYLDKYHPDLDYKSLYEKYFDTMIVFEPADIVYDVISDPDLLDFALDLRLIDDPNDYLNEILEQDLVGSLQVLLDHGADPNYVPTIFDISPLRTAVIRNNTIAALLLLKYGARIENGLLKQAIYNNNFFLLQLLVENGADVNEVDEEEGYSPLFLAVSYDRLEMVDYLLRHGADINSLKEGFLEPLTFYY